MITTRETRQRGAKQRIEKAAEQREAAAVANEEMQCERTCVRRQKGVREESARASGQRHAQAPSQKSQPSAECVCEADHGQQGQGLELKLQQENTAAVVEAVARVGAQSDPVRAQLSGQAAWQLVNRRVREQNNTAL